jgi:hypothetical protein
MKITFEQFLEGNRALPVSPREGMYLGYCPFCLEWKPLLTWFWAAMLIYNPSEQSDRLNVPPVILAALDEAGDSDDPDFCLECAFIKNKAAARKIARMTEAELEEHSKKAEEKLELVGVCKTIVALSQAGMTGNEISQILGVKPEDLNF